jgi:cytochrome c553
MMGRMSDLPVRGSRVLALVLLAVGAGPAMADDPGVAIALQRGESLYATCSACHGASGMGQPEGPAPVLAAQHETVLLRQLTDYRDGVRWDPRMEHVARLRIVARPDDLAALSSFISRLDPSRPAAMGPGEGVAAGARAFVMGCAACHGATGQGDAARGVPRLAGQHHGYLRRQVQDAVEGRRPGLQASHGRRFATLSAAEIDGLADYLSRNVRRTLSPPPR